MSETTDQIPFEVLHRFLRSQMKCKLVVVAISGCHAHGYARNDSPLELKGIHVEPTEMIVGLTQPPKTVSWVGEFEAFRLDYSSVELGEAFSRLLRGDGSLLERILAPRQMIDGEDLTRLQRVARGVMCRRFYHYYKNFARGLSRECELGERRSVRHILGVYRVALTGVHLLSTGEIELDLMTLARTYRLEKIERLIHMYQREHGAVVPHDSPWLNRIVRLHALMESALERTALPPDPADPGAVETYLLDMRRRFFDAPTIQDD